MCVKPPPIEYPNCRRKQVYDLQYKHLLVKNGHGVVVAQDGQECLEKIQQRSEEPTGSQADSPFDVIILDHGVPNKTGENTVKKILEKTQAKRYCLSLGIKGGQ
jgi:CheY-like chemotaxis protein